MHISKLVLGDIGEWFRDWGLGFQWPLHSGYIWVTCVLDTARHLSLFRRVVETVDVYR